MSGSLRAITCVPPREHQTTCSYIKHRRPVLPTGRAAWRYRWALDVIQTRSAGRPFLKVQGSGVLDHAHCCLLTCVKGCHDQRPRSSSSEGHPRRSGPELALLKATPVHPLAGVAAKKRLFFAGLISGIPSCGSLKIQESSRRQTATAVAGSRSKINGGALDQVNLMTLIRLVAFLAIAWVLLAMGPESWVWEAIWPVPRRISCCVRPITMPSRSGHPNDLSKEELHSRRSHDGADRAAFGPYRPQMGALERVTLGDEEGELEAAGRWVSRVDGSEKPAACYGVGLFRIFDGTVLDRLELEVLPTGRPARSRVVPERFCFRQETASFMVAVLPAIVET